MPLSDVSANADTYQINPQKTPSGISNFMGNPAVKTVVGYFTGGATGAIGGAISGSKGGSKLNGLNSMYGSMSQDGSSGGRTSFDDNSDAMNRRYQNSLGTYNYDGGS